MKRLIGKPGTFFDTVEDRNQKAILTKIVNFITPRDEVAVGSRNATSGRDAAINTASSECGEQIEKTASFENASERDNTLHEVNTNDEIRENFQAILTR